METATFGAGCFWGVEATFRKVPGVVNVAVGYSGGDVEDPTYQRVCAGNTGHAEVVHLEYDPAVVGFEDLLEVFWSCHDPTTLNRQGPDIGTQYRSVVFYQTPEQEEAARASRDEVAKRSPDPIVTEIVPFEEFYRAEEYHQRYLEKRGL